VLKTFVMFALYVVGFALGYWCLRVLRRRRAASALARHGVVLLPVTLRLSRPGIRARWRGGLLIIDGDETRWRRRWRLRRRDTPLGTLTRVDRRAVKGSEHFWLESDSAVYRCESSVGDLQLAVPAAHQPTFERLVGGWTGAA
jgi:hypothetical protein